jgi:hypothetical protein
MEKSRKNLPHPEGEVGCCGSEEQIDGVALLVLEEFAFEAKVAFEIADTVKW